MGTKVVRYGANGSYIYQVFTDGVKCETNSFGGQDPAGGTTKSCYYRDMQFDDGIKATASGRNKAVTVSLNVYSTQVGTLTDLKNSITVEKTGEPAFSALGANDTVALSNTGTSSTLVIHFNTALVGTANAIKIAPGALMNQSGTPYPLGVEINHIAELDLTPVAYTGSTSSYGNDLLLSFSKLFTINTNDATVIAANTYLKNRMSIATDGVNFAPLSKQIDVQLRNYNTVTGSNQISLSAQNDMKVIMGTKTLIKIASGTMKNAAGELNEEMILHVTPPVIQTATIISKSDFHDVKVSFHESVVDNTYSNGVSNLASTIKLIRNGSYDPIPLDLKSGDKASVDSNGNLIVHFETALTGANNQIIIGGGALKDSYGNVLNNEASTPFIQGDTEIGDSSPFRLVSSYLTNGYQDLVLVFNKDVQNARSDDASFRANTSYTHYNGNGWSWQNLPETAALNFSGKTVTIHFAEPMTKPQYLFQFYQGSFKDMSGNILSFVSAGWFYPNQPLELNRGSMSQDGRWLTLNFNKGIEDGTIVNGLSNLKNLITLSADNGSSFQSLDTQDTVIIQGNNLVVLFQNAKQSGTVEVKIPASALSDLGNNVRSQEINQVVAYNYPDITGFFLSDTASEFIFKDNEEWRSKVKDIIVVDNYNEVGRPLNSTEYTLAAGRLVIHKGVFLEGRDYYVTIVAEGYSSKEFYGRASVSTELFYMTAPSVTTDNGITATVNILNHYNNDSGTQAVVFELMNGATPVSIVASNLNIRNGAYSANFNVADAATNPNYTVKVFVVNHFNNDSSNIGINLASIKTQDELDQIELEIDN
ncbi:hemoblobin-interacting domain-containing protein [Paenibacillus sp. RC67]|uniref:hemoblobin-interacting domain-containing protein n=1 Tax=Paenibacillus sp. RC67 TaxID=3039392 RepID=UPI0024AD37C7|nr:hemoblobin-interacting domain-containing protein [Paenibacillus sp. RC67]